MWISGKYFTCIFLSGYTEWQRMKSSPEQGLSVGCVFSTFWRMGSLSEFPKDSLTCGSYCCSLAEAEVVKLCCECAAALWTLCPTEQMRYSAKMSHKLRGWKEASWATRIKMERSIPKPLSLILLYGAADVSFSNKDSLSEVATTNSTLLGLTSDGHSLATLQTVLFAVWRHKLPTRVVYVSK